MTARRCPQGSSARRGCWSWRPQRDSMSFRLAWSQRDLRSQSTACTSAVLADSDIRSSAQPHLSCTLTLSLREPRPQYPACVSLCATSDPLRRHFGLQDETVNWTPVDRLQGRGVPAVTSDPLSEVWSVLVWSGLVWPGLVWSGLNQIWSGLVWSGLISEG